MHTEWNRGLLWSEHDRRPRDGSLAALATIIAVAFGVMTYACTELYFVQDDLQTRAGAKASDEPDDCTVDDDCVVMPAIVTCCGECEPVPPFEAAPRVVLDDLRGDCVPRERLCEPPVCTPKPPGCDARAVCRDHHCRAVAGERCPAR